MNNTIPTQWEYWEDYCNELEKRVHVIPQGVKVIDWNKSNKVPIRIDGVDYYIDNIFGVPWLVIMDE